MKRKSTVKRKSHRLLVKLARALYEAKAVELESLPKQIKQQYRFYEEGAYHPDLTKHAFLESVWITEEENEITNAAFHVLLQARKKFDPYYRRGFHQ